MGSVVERREVRGRRGSSSSSSQLSACPQLGHGESLSKENSLRTTGTTSASSPPSPSPPCSGTRVWPPLRPAQPSNLGPRQGQPLGRVMTGETFRYLSSTTGGGIGYLGKFLSSPSTIITIYHSSSMGCERLNIPMSSLLFRELMTCWPEEAARRFCQSFLS